MTKQVRLNGPGAFAALQSWSQAAGPVTVLGAVLGDGLLMALIEAEALAVTAGARPMPPIGEQVVLSDLGAARSLLSSVREDVATVYLAVHGAVRLAHQSARRPWRWEVLERLIPPGLGTPLAVWVLGGVGLAAAVIGGWYYQAETKKEEVRVSGDNLRAVQVASTVASLAQPYVVSGQPIPPALLEPLRDLARVERAAPVLPWVGAAAVAGVAAGALWGRDG